MEEMIRKRWGPREYVAEIAADEEGLAEIKEKVAKIRDVLTAKRFDVDLLEQILRSGGHFDGEMPPIIRFVRFTHLDDEAKCLLSISLWLISATKAESKWLAKFRGFAGGKFDVFDMIKKGKGLNCAEYAAMVVKLAGDFGYRGYIVYEKDLNPKLSDLLPHLVFYSDTGKIVDVLGSVRKIGGLALSYDDIREQDQLKLEANQAKKQAASAERYL